MDKLLSALNQVEAKRTTELDPVEDRWAVECELGLVHMAEKAAKMANEVMVWLYEHTTLSFLLLFCPRLEIVCSNR